MESEGRWGHLAGQGTAEYVQRFPLEIQNAAALPAKTKKERTGVFDPGVALWPFQDTSRPSSRTGACARFLYKLVVHWQQERVKTLL